MTVNYERIRQSDLIERDPNLGKRVIMVKDVLKERFVVCIESVTEDGKPAEWEKLTFFNSNEEDVAYRCFQSMSMGFGSYQ